MNNLEGMTVFLSHSTKDADFVGNLAIALEASGFAPWRCEVDIDKGEDFVSKINEGLAQSDVALLVWSPEAANSVWTEQEWTSQKARQVEENKIRLLVIMLRQHPLPPLLRTSNYIDARWDPAAGIRKTVEWLKGRQSVQRLSGLHAPVYLPDYRPRDFVGRTTYLTHLQETLTTEPGMFLLYGEPGSGKSTLTLRFAWEAQKDFDAVIFQTCGQRSLDTVTAEMVERLPIDVKSRPPEEQREAAKAWLRQRQSLLVLDDVMSVQMRQLEPGPNCSVLYTSRLSSLPGIASTQSAKVEKFTESEVEDLFHTYLDTVFGQSEVTRQRDALLGFARRVEMLPIAVAVGASLLREKSASALDRAVLKLQLDALTDGSKDVNALFRMAIVARPERDQRLLAACAACVQEGFWLPLVAEIADLSDDDAEDVASRLVHSSLLRVSDRERRRFQLHGLLRDVAAANARLCDDGIRLQERHAVAVEKLFKDWEARWQECRECLEEIVPAARFLWEQAQHGRGRQLGSWGCELGRRIGELDAAFRIAQEQESLWAGRNDREGKIGLRSCYRYEALILRRWGRGEEALALHKQEEAICKELEDKDGLQRSYGDQALILRLGGRLQEALALHEKEEMICLELDNKDGLQTSYGNRAAILRARGQLADALVLHKKQEAICLQLGNKDGLQRSYGDQAITLIKLDYLEEALILLRKQEAICLQLGNKDSLQRSYGYQAIILTKRHRLKEALTLLQKGEEICLELDNIAGLGYCYWQWASLARAQDDRKAESEKLERALAIFTELKMPIECDAVKAELLKMGGL
jgi:tetratricopeptide (TPR) repeat protein